MTKTENLALLYARDNAGRFLDDLKELCSIPSISSIPAYAGEVRRAAGKDEERARPPRLATGLLGLGEDL